MEPSGGTKSTKLFHPSEAIISAPCATLTQRNTPRKTENTEKYFGNFRLNPPVYLEAGSVIRYPLCPSAVGSCGGLTIYHILRRAWRERPFGAARRSEVNGHDARRGGDGSCLSLHGGFALEFGLRGHSEPREGPRKTTIAHQLD